MSILSVLLVCALVCTLVQGQVVYDFCGIGAGHSGLTAAVYAKDNGAKTFLILERDDEIGGNVNTICFPLPPFIPAGSPSCTDMGVAALPDTAKQNSSGQWTFDSAAHCKRFTDNNSLIYFDLTQPSPIPSTFHLADFGKGLYLGPQTATPEGQYATFMALLSIKAYVSQYPWMDTANIPAQVPAELQQDFGSLLRQHPDWKALEASVFVQVLSTFGIANFSQVPAFYALMDLKPTLMRIFTEPNMGFTIAGGVIRVAHGMADYVGWDNIKTSATVTKVVRPYGEGAIKVHYRLGVGSGSHLYVAQCKNLFVGFPPTLESTSFIDLDLTERAALKDFQYTYLYAIATDIQGGLAPIGSGFQLNYINITDEFLQYQQPAVGYISRSLPYGLSHALLSSQYPLSSLQVEAIFNQQMSVLPPGLATSYDITDIDNHDQYQPWLSFDKIAEVPNAHYKLRALQGHRRTWWDVTSADSVAAMQVSMTAAGQMSFA